jgi:uncharacterized coiled-coil DUF342 family protein
MADSKDKAEDKPAAEIEDSSKDKSKNNTKDKSKDDTKDKPKDKSKNNNKEDTKDTDKDSAEEISVEDKIKKTRKHLEDAEKRYQSMIEKRDELHKEGNLLKEERDALHAQKRDTVDEIKTLKDERAELVEVMRSHKSRRDQAQNEAKRLIARKRGKSQEIYQDLSGQIDDLETELKIMDYEYQTKPLTMEEENEHLDKIREKYTKLVQLKKLNPKHEVLLGEIDDINERITGLFKLADDEHKEVDKYYKKSQKVHEKIQTLNEGIQHLVDEANKKHAEFLKINERSNHFHKRAMEMRGKILSIRRERKEVITEARKVVDDINLGVKQKFEDEDVLDQAADDAIKKLKSKGKINL